MIFRGVAVAVVTVATCGLVLGVASAHKTSFKTEALIESHSTGDALVLMGDTFSPKEKCVRRRRVSIFRKRAGDDKLVGKGRTDGAGVFQIAVAEMPGTYYAKVKKKNIGPGSHRHICKGARSPNYQVKIAWRRHTAKFETKVKIKDFVMPEMRGDVPGSFFGRVRSSLEGCAKNRKVKVFRRQVGDDQLEGKATSDADGLFAAPVKLSGAGVFYAKVRRRVIGSGPHEHVCKGARSPNFLVV